MVRPPYQPHSVRNNDPDEADNSAEANGGSGYQSGNPEQNELDLFHIDTELLRLFFIELHNI